MEYINNEERRGDFEGVITEIDAYNKAQSNTANYFQYNDDAILKILKLGDVSSDDVRDMKEKGAIILDDGGDVQWLLKQVDDTAMENLRIGCGRISIPCPMFRIYVMSLLAGTFLEWQSLISSGDWNSYVP